MTQLAAFTKTLNVTSPVTRLKPETITGRYEQNCKQRILPDLFDDLNKSDKAILVQRKVTRTFPKSTILSSDQSNTNALWMVDKGRVKITKTHKNGKEFTLAIHASGDYFGEIGLVHEKLSSEFVVTMERTRLSFLRRRDVQPILMRNPKLVFKLMKVLAMQLDLAYQRIESLALLDVCQRVTLLLTNLAEQRDNALIIAQMPSHADIASLIGASREMVSRVIKLLVAGGYITIENRKTTILKKIDRIHKATKLQTS